MAARAQFVIVPKWIADHTKLSPDAKIVWITLAGFMDWRTHDCWPRIETIRERTGFSVSTIRRRTRELEEAGAITRRRGQRGNFYHVRTEAESVGLTDPTGQSDRFQSVTADRSEPPASLLTERKPQNKNQERETPTKLAGLVQTSEQSPPAAHDFAIASLKPETRTEPVADEVPAAAIIPTSSPSEPPFPKLQPNAATCSHGAPPSPVDKLIRQTFNQLQAGHPSPGMPVRGLENLAKLMRNSKNPDDLAKRLLASMARWREIWKKQEERKQRVFVPQIWRWIVSGDWKLPPPLSPEEYADSPEGRRAAREAQDRREREERQRLERERQETDDGIDFETEIARRRADEQEMIKRWNAKAAAA